MTISIQCTFLTNWYFSIFVQMFNAVGTVICKYFQSCARNQETKHSSTFSAEIFRNLILFKFCTTCAFLKKKNYAYSFNVVHHQGQGKELNTFFHVFDWNPIHLNNQFCLKFLVHCRWHCSLHSLPRSFKQQRPKSYRIFTYFNWKNLWVIDFAQIFFQKFIVDDF